jgi:RNA polymerase sigma-70 factor (ECF subfamily)
LTEVGNISLVPAVQQPEATDAAFATHCDAALRRVLGLAGYLLGNVAEAEDATQEAMAQAWRARRSLRDPAAFDAWLDRIVVNLCRDRLRRRKVVRMVDLEDGAGLEALDPFHDFLARDDLASALDALTPDQRVVVVLRFWRDLSLDQIAERLDWPLGTVKSRLHHAVAALRSRLQEDLVPADGDGKSRKVRS